MIRRTGCALLIVTLVVMFTQTPVLAAEEVDRAQNDASDALLAAEIVQRDHLPEIRTEIGVIAEAIARVTRDPATAPQLRLFSATQTPPVPATKPTFFKTPAGWVTLAAIAVVITVVVVANHNRSGSIY